MTNRIFPIWPLLAALLAAAIFSGTFSNVCADLHEINHQFTTLFDGIEENQQLASPAGTGRYPWTWK